MLNNKIEVAKGFQTSVNIAYDIHNKNKVAAFIPTMSSLDIFEDVLLSTAPNSTDRARILIGAYGRGKSHIILVLLSLLLQKDKKQFKRLLKKMKVNNPKLYEYTNEYLNSNQRLLPIVISGSSTSLTQSFLLALQQALSENGLTDIMPETHFKASLNTIESWKADYPDTYKKFLKALNEPIDNFVLALKEYNVEAYEKFIELYPTLTSGSTFNPFLGFDVVELYEKVVDKLKDKKYDGVYIIYDEFSKYLEASIGNATISDIKLLQDFAEKCVRSENKQMHLMLICHKDIANYIDNNLPKEKVDGWRGVSGRFKHVNLHNNFSQMYEIISEVIIKKQPAWNTFIEEHMPKFDDLKHRFTTNGLLDSKDEAGINSAIIGCYPLHPISTFILPRLSEKVAQNERTLFTFLSSEEKFSLSAFLDTAEGDFPMLTPDYLYDYFEPLFRKEPYTSDIHKMYKLTSNILKKVAPNSISSKIVKTLSLIYIVEQFEKLPPIYDIIVDAYRDCVEDTKLISNALEDLINKDCIVYLRRSNNYLKLKESSGIDIPGEISKHIESTKASTSVKEILNKSSFDSYMYPTRYNDEHEITRYFDFLFIDSKEFWSVDDWNLKINDTMADGVVYAIIPESAEEIKRIKRALADGNCNHDRIIFCIPRKYQNIEKIAYEYKAVTELKALVVDDELQSDEYEIYIEDLEEVINSFIASYARPENKSSDYYYNGRRQQLYRKAQMSALLSDICEQTYPHAPTINNESINKNVLPTVAVNSRTKLLNGLLDSTLEVNLGLTGTGQDVSIMRSTLIQTGILLNPDSTPELNITPDDQNITYMLNTIQAFFAEAGINGEQSFGTLYERLTSPQFGIGLKAGVIPIYVAVILHLNRSNIVVKNGNSEVKLSAELLNGINENPQKYSVILEDWNDEKAAYLGNLEQLFSQHIHEQEKAYNSFAYIVYAMNRWYMSLPKYAKEMSKTYLGVNAHEPLKKISPSHVRFIKSLKQLDNINPREYLFEKIFTVFGLDGFHADVVDSIAQTKQEYDSSISRLLKSLIYDTKALFTPKGSPVQGSLTSIIQDWYSCLKKTTIQHLFANNENHTLELMKTITNDESAFIQRLAKCITALRVEDWNEGTIKTYNSDLAAFKNTVEEYNSQEVLDTKATDTYKLITTNSDGQEIVKSFSRTEYTDRAKLLFNEITNSIDEMGQSISEQEKRQILIEILEKLC